MPVRARFRPHPRGFGFLNPVGADGVTETTFSATDDDGATRELDSLFCPPPVATGLVADDLVDVGYEVDEKGATATSVTLVQRARRMAVGTVQQGPGSLVIEADHSIATGWITLDASLTPKLQMAMGRQVVVLIADGEDGAPVGRALVAGPHVKGSPQAVRARAVVAAMGGSAPSLFAGGPAKAGLDPVAAQTTHTRIVGMLAGGARGGAAGLDTEGPVPGADLELHDRRAEPCITIDDASTQDVDDAIVAHWDGGEDEVVEAAVHIADVAAFVGVGSAADRYARVMASTAYLTVGHNAPMLDPALSEDALSLLPGVDRRAITVRFTVDHQGNIGDVDVESAVVSSDAKLSYAAVESWLDGETADLVREAGQASDEAEAILTATVEAARRLGVERDARATFEDLFQDAELEPAILDGKLRTKEAEPHARAYRLIERFMVAANEAVAGWLVKHDIPALYRAHVGLDPERADRLRAAVELVGADVPALTDPEAESDDVMGQLLGEIERLGAEGNEADRDLLVAVATGSTARATYDVDPAHHRGLAASAYTHFTSPIRRYADLVVHRQIRSALAGEEPVHAAEDLGPLAAWLDFRSGAVSRAQAFERGDLWAVLLDRGFLDRPEPAVVIGLSAAGLRVRIPRLGLNGFVTAERALGLPPKERGKLEVDEHGLETTSGPWRLGSRIEIKATGLDATGRPNLRLA